MACELPKACRRNVQLIEQIAKVKERVEEKAGIPPAQQRLIYGGKAM